MTHYVGSGLSRTAFCQTQKLSVATLARYLERTGSAASDRVPSASLVAVELTEATRPTESGLTLVLPGGPRLTIQRGFCTETLHQVLAVLERR